MTKDQIKAKLLKHGFKEKDQGDGRMDLNPYVYAAVDEILAGDRYRFTQLVAHAQRQDAQIAELWARINTHRLYEERDVWFWERDGENHPESLVCPVVIEAEDLRHLLAGSPTMEVAGLQRHEEAMRSRLESATKSLGVCAPEKPYTYTSSQATNCAGCGNHKHTPLRVDGMGGYVCLTCIDKRLERLLDEEDARTTEKDWDGCQKVADLPAVHEALKAFSEDSTGDAGVLVVQAVIEALARGYIALTPAELQSGYDRVKWAEGLVRQLPPEHEGRNSWLLNYGAKESHLTQPGALEWDAGPGVPAKGDGDGADN